MSHFTKDFTFFYTFFIKIDIIKVQIKLMGCIMNEKKISNILTFLPVGICLGTGVGLLIGVVCTNAALGIVLGVSIGIVLGLTVGILFDKLFVKKK